MVKKCGKGYNCGEACIEKTDSCEKQLDNQSNINKLETARSSAKYNFSKVLAEGNYGRVELDEANNLVRKVSLDGKGFGEHELSLAKQMGEAGFAPKVHPDSNDTQIIMDVAQGKPLWKDYRQAEDEPQSMPEAPARKGLEALLYMHKELGFAHGDTHVKQFLIDGDDLQLIDFGLSKPIESAQDATLALTDLSKSYKFLGLERFPNDPAVAIVDKYRAVKGTSKAAKAEKDLIVQEYYNFINS